MTFLLKLIRAGILKKNLAKMVKQMNKFILLTIATFLFIMFFAPTNVFAKRKFKEKVYQEYYCEKWGGQSEVILKDKSRCDCLTEKYAMEFDFADNWAEAIGQSLYYAIMLDKKPAIVLICENMKKDMKHINRLATVLNEICPKIKIFLIDIEEFRKSKNNFKDELTKRFESIN